MAVATVPQLSVTEGESTAVTEALLKQKMEELNRLKDLKAKNAEKDAEKAAAAARAAAEKKAKEAILPGGIPPQVMPHWRTYVPACGVLVAVRGSVGMTTAETVFAVFCLLISVFLGQQLLNRVENTEWRRNLRMVSEARNTLPQGREVQAKGGRQPEKVQEGGLRVDFSALFLALWREESGPSPFAA